MLYNNIVDNHKKETKILFYKIKNDTSNLLSKLLFQYYKQEVILKDKHNLVLEYLQGKENLLDIDLNKIYRKINKNTSTNPYNIYITDKDLVIKNTTYKADIGFNLSFAKDTFDEHLKNNIIGCCTPLFEKSSKIFLSFTDSYIIKDNKKIGVVQVSYNYLNIKDQFKRIEDLISKYPNIEDAKAYILVNTGFINDLILKDFSSYKPNLKEILQKIEDGLKVKDHLGNKILTINKFIKNGIEYREMYMSAQSPIFDNTKIIYSILLNETKFNNDIINLNKFIFIITILGVITIIIITKIRDNETKLNNQDKFVQSAMHEIKTPLSVITLNNELRELEFGKDIYSKEIESALKILQNSYDDMSFAVTKNQIDYKIEKLLLKNIIIERIEYFNTIAKVSNKIIEYDLKSNCIVQISLLELVRIVDNSLSNAIKYSEKNSIIKVVLINNILSFHNNGIIIKNKKQIFKKYFRENNIIGGYGLGLSIISDILKKYNIHIEVNSTIEDGTTFKYRFKCCIDDII